MNRISLPKAEWDERLLQLLSSYEIFLPVENGSVCDYAPLNEDSISRVVYNRPKPVTPLKHFFLPYKENVTHGSLPEKPLLILGAPSCDMWALRFLDQIYLDEEYPDPVYRERRKNSLVGVADCFSIQENCHCTSYGIPPVAEEPADLGVALVEDRIVLSLLSERSASLPEKMGIVVSLEPEAHTLERLEELQQEVIESLHRKNLHLPGYEESGELIKNASEEEWRKNAADCVSCGACSAICPSCSCFLLVDRPGFEKVRQLDTCQYPGFERVAGGEDSLGNLEVRFRNRYFCKYVWKPEKYTLKACTGCGRCIETCIGEIDKNKILTELANP